MANYGLNVSDVLNSFYDVQKNSEIDGLYEVRAFGEPNAEIQWYFFYHNNATYNKKSKVVILRDINQNNSGYLDCLKKAFEKAKKENRKIFWLAFVYGDGIGINQADMEWLVSIELLVKLDDIPASLYMRDYPRGGAPAEAWAPCCKRVDQDKYFNTTFISCKDSSGDLTKEYMDMYFELYDNRPHHDFINANGVEKVDLKYLFDLDNGSFAEESLAILEKYVSLDDEIFDNMIDPAKSDGIVHLKGYSILKEVPDTIDTDDKLKDFVKCGTERSKYYTNKHQYHGKNYVITNNWYYKSVSNPDNRTPYVRWIIDAMRRNGVIAYISSEVVIGAENIILYGVPGAGKSNHINTNYLNLCYDYERVVFHPDYTYSDFTGQIMPRIDENNGGKLRYEFVPGPFTKILKKAIYNPDRKLYLVVEEINRGNAAAIFGELFQLLDRLDSGESDYEITNYEIAKYVYGNPDVKIKLPSNLWILGTMNTADQNVFTLDTAFQRRWDMQRIPNDVKNGKRSKEMIADSEICWGAFAYVINGVIVNVDQELGGSSDKRLGAYFVGIKDLSRKRFSEKVVKYLWDDALKMEQNRAFNSSIKNVDDAITKYETCSGDPVKAVIKDDLFSQMQKETAALLAVSTSVNNDEQDETSDSASDSIDAGIQTDEEANDEIIVDPDEEISD